MYDACRKEEFRTHSTNGLESDIITFCIYSNEYLLFFVEDTVSTTQSNYRNVKLNYVSLHYSYN